jgi:hypothetical protein
MLHTAAHAACSMPRVTQLHRTRPMPLPACCPSPACWLCRFVQTYKIPTAELINYGYRTRPIPIPTPPPRMSPPSHISAKPNVEGSVCCVGHAHLGL